MARILQAQVVKPGNFRKILLGILILIFLIVLFFSSFRQIGTGQIGVVTQFGKVTGRELGEGLHIVAPFGINRVARYDIKVLKQSEEAQAASKDLQDVAVTLALNYHIEAKRVSEVHRTIGTLYGPKLIDPALQEVFKATSAKFSAQELITSRAEVKADVYKQLKERLEKYGVVVDDVSLVNFKFSASFAKAIEEKQVAQQNAERSKFNLEAAQIDSQSQQVQSATLSPLFLQKEAIEKWDGKLPTYLGQDTVFNIPLR